MDRIECVAISNSITFFERKQFQEDITADETNSRTLKASFKNIKGTPQYMSNMKSDTIAKNRSFNVYTFFGTFTPAEAHWLEFPQIIARLFGINLIDEDVQNMSMKERHNWLKRNPANVARHMDHKYKVIFGRTVLMSGMHPIGQILNYDSKREFQLRGTEHQHCSFHIMGAPRIDENDDSEVTTFIDKYITCSIPNEKEYPALNKLVNKVQQHRLTLTCRKMKGVTCYFNACCFNFNGLHLMGQDLVVAQMLVKKS